MTAGRPRVGAVLAVAVLATATPAAAEPRGALDLTSELLLTGGPPRQRVGVAATAYVSRRLGLRAAVHLVSLDPFADQAVATVGVAYRAAAARPRLEVVVRAEAGVARPLAPVAGVGSTTYLWPTRWPLALGFDLGATAIIDGVADSRITISLGLGVSLAR